MDPSTSRRLAKATEAAATQLQSFAEERRRVLCSMRTKDSKMQYLNPARYKKLYPFIHKCMRASLNELCARLPALPRELGDLIYDFVWSAWRNKVRPLLHDCASRPEAFSYSTIPAISLRFLPNIARADCVSKRIIHEASEQLERQLVTSPATLSPKVTIISIDRIPDFLKGNYFHVEISHEQLCRASDLQIRFNSCITGFGGCLCCSRRDLFALKLDGMLDNLLTLPSGSSIYTRDCTFPRPRVIIFDFSEIDRVSHDDLSVALQILSRLSHELKAKGFDVRFSYTFTALGMTARFGALAWQWTREEWLHKLQYDPYRAEGENALCTLGGVEFYYPPGARSRLGFYRIQRPIWNAIMVDLYRVGQRIT